MVSFQNILLAAAIISAASADGNYRTSMTSDSFNNEPAASAYDGKPIQFDYFTAPSVDKGLHYLHKIKPVVMRLNDGAIDFTPHQEVARGREDPINCRNPDGSVKGGHEGGPCTFHCTNHGRYCDMGSFNHHATKGRHKVGLPGRLYVEQSGLRTCIWKIYGTKRGHNEMFRYFQYHDALKGTGCDSTLTKECVEETMNSVDFNYEDMDYCMGDTNMNDDLPNRVFEHLIVDRSVDFASRSTIPALFIQGKESPDFDGLVWEYKHGEPSTLAPNGTESVLQMVCDAMPDDPSTPKPHVCNFCLNWCPGTVGEDAFDMDTCLWELKCGDEKTGFEDYMKQYRRHHPDAHVMTSSSQSDESSSSEGVGIIATIMAVIFAAGFSALAIMAIRVWRTKMIIDRYVKEQQAMNGSGVDGHRDPTFFPPDDSELDLDLEPALQYSDHISPTAGRTSPPQQANFLPQLT